MNLMEPPKHYHHHYHYSYPQTLKSHLSSLAFVSVFLVLIFIFAFHFIAPARPLVNLDQLSVSDIVLASISTFYRLLIAYTLALIFAIPLSLTVVSTPRLEKILLPFFDVLQSIPVLAFFPLVVLVFIKINLFEGAAIFVLFMAMLWNLVFSMIGGLKTIPQDITAAAFVFKATGLKKLTQVTLPAIFPFIVTGSLLAWAQGWNIIIVAEVLHNYIPNGTPMQDLFGLGSLLVSASFQAKNVAFLGGIIAMVLLIGALNFFVWQKLLHLAERYKFD